MSNFPKIHGLELAQNGYVINAVIENLANDPVSPVAGRIWFNTTTKTFRQPTAWNAGICQRRFVRVVRHRRRHHMVPTNPTAIGLRAHAGSRVNRLDRNAQLWKQESNLFRL